MICHRRSPHCRRTSSRTCPGSLIWEADPYSPRISCGERPDKPALSEGFCGENPRRKTSTHIRLRRRIYPQRPHVKGVSPEPLPELHGRASIGDCGSGITGEMGFVGDFLGGLHPAAPTSLDINPVTPECREAGRKLESTVVGSCHERRGE